MRTALLIHGQPRFVEQCFPYINNNIIIPNSCDVFIHSWYDSSLIDFPYKYGGTGNWVHQRIPKDIDKKIIELYNPISYLIEPSKKFKNASLDFSNSISKYYKGALERPNLEPDFRNRQINNMYSLWYSVMQANILKKNYELANDFKYDTIIQTRFDLEIKNPITCSTYDKNVLHYMEMGQPDGMIADWINFGSSEIMDNYASIFLNIETHINQLLKERTVFCNELLIRKICDFFNIKYSAHSFNITLPRF